MQLVSIMLWQFQPLVEGVSLLLLTIVQRGFPRMTLSDSSRGAGSQQQASVRKTDLSRQELGETSTQESR